MMIKHEAPSGYVYYNGCHLARVVFSVEGSGLKWILLSRKQAEKIDLHIDDGLENSLWDNLQQNGEREDYSYAFCNSSYPVLAPRHIINANKVMYMFMGCTELLKANNILVNVTEERPNMMYACANCSKMTVGPFFNFIDVPIVKTYTSMYAGCVSLEEVKIYWGNGTADPITQRNSCQNMFYRCKKLKDIDFGDAETGSPIYLDLSYSPDVTIKSFESLLNSLKIIDIAVANEEGSKHEITISTASMEMLNLEENLNILNGFSEKGWTLIGKDREQKEIENEEV